MNPQEIPKPHGHRAVPVGAPARLAVDKDRQLVYVANSFCNTISEINGTTNRLNSAVTFTSDPPTSGTISSDPTLPDPWHAFKNNEFCRFDDGRSTSLQDRRQLAT